MRGKLAAAIAFLAVACGSAGGGGVVVGSPLTINQLKFKVVDAVGVPVFCDPDFYPVARLGGEQSNADSFYPQIRADIEPGMLVWTATPDGQRVAAPVIEIGSMAVPPGHLMVHMRLADGRELLASPGHRTSDRRPLGSLAAGDGVDGSKVTLWELVPY